MEERDLVGARPAVRSGCSSGCPVPRSVASESAPTSSAARIGCSTYMPIAWYPLSTYSVVPVTFLAASLNR
jgi:hypothetical protein